MSQPASYTPAHAFVGDSAIIPNFPGQQLDVEFQALKTTTDQVRTNLALIQRDDGALQNAIVTYDSLSASVQSNGIAPANPWASGNAYGIGTAVTINSNLYRCIVAHTSGVFATDLAALKWTLVSSLPSGANGTNGNTVLNGAGAPSSGLGNNGDFYLNTTNSTLYGPKTAGAWGSGVSLIGPAGAMGGPGVSVDSEIAIYSGTSGTTLKRATVTGLLKAASGVLAQAVANTDYLTPPSGSAILKANSGGALANAAAGTDYLAPPSGTAILKANSGGALANAVSNTDYCAATTGSSVLKGSSGGTTPATAGVDFVKPDTTSAFTAGFTATSFSDGTITGAGQTLTPAPASGNFQHATLNGSSLTGNFTFAVPASVCSMVVEVTNGGSGSVGATLVTSGYTKVTGDTYATTNGNKYNFCITKTQNYSHLHIQALQ